MHRVIFGNEITLWLVLSVVSKFVLPRKPVEYLTTMITTLVQLKWLKFPSTQPCQKYHKNMTWVLWPTHLLTTPLLDCLWKPLHLSMPSHWSQSKLLGPIMPHFLYTGRRHSMPEISSSYRLLSIPLSTLHSEHSVSSILQCVSPQLDQRFWSIELCYIQLGIFSQPLVWHWVTII